MIMMMMMLLLLPPLLGFPVLAELAACLHNQNFGKKNLIKREVALII